MVSLAGQDSRTPLPRGDGDALLREGPCRGRVRLAGSNVHSGRLLIILGLTGLKRYRPVVEDVHAQKKRHRRAVACEREAQHPVVLELREREYNGIIYGSSDVLSTRCQEKQSYDESFHNIDDTGFTFGTPPNRLHQFVSEVV